MLREAIARMVAGEHLDEQTAEAVMGSIMEGEATPAQVGALLVGLRMKGETVGEITGFARAMRARAHRIDFPHPLLADTCGTGGDGAGTFNISTGAALVAAAAGLPVAKHGNRSVSSRCGSADVLEALGVPVKMDPAQARACLEATGFTFLFAPVFHPAMRHAAGPRREIGVRTVFNILGPLTNPAGARVQVVGVFGPEWVRPLAEVLRCLGVREAFVVHGAGGTDELTPAGPAIFCRVADGRLEEGYLDPADYGFARAPLEALAGGDAATNARILREVLEGRPGPQREAVVLNAALALVAGGLAGDIKEGAHLARTTIDSGAALGKLEEVVSFGRRLGGRDGGVWS